jgi:RNA polymerase sigma-70 factor (ECF subfamily)
MGTDLTEVFRRHAPAALPGGDEGELERALRDLVGRGLAAHPGCAVSAEQLVGFLAERVDAGAAADLAALVEQLERLNVEDLCLACGCLHGDDAAGRTFLERCAPAVAGALRGLRLPEQRLEEVQGMVFSRLFVGQPGRPPKIAHYRGEGDLTSWVKVVAVRLLLNELRAGKGKVQLEVEDLLDRAMDSAEEPADLRYMKTMYRQQFKQAFGRAVEELAPKQRNILRYQLLDEMGAAQIAKVYRVHRATVHRWQQQIQRALLDRTRDHLQRQLGIDSEELDSIVRLIQSTWQVTVSGILHQSRAPDGE